MQRFEPQMTVDQALALHPKARWVFAAYQLSGCNHCTLSADETLQQVAAGYQLQLDCLLNDLNSLFA